MTTREQRPGASGNLALPALAICGRLAAPLALVAIGFGAGSIWGRSGREVPQPVLNVPVVELFPQHSAWAGGSREPVALRVDDVFVLVLSLEAEAGERHDLEIVDENERVAWRSVGLSPDPLGGYTLSLTRSALGDGTYRLLVKASGATEPTDEFVFSVAPPA